MKFFNSILLITLLLIATSQTLFAQGFLHAKGKYIYDGAGNEVILRGIGTGNWMIQEGYMMQTSDIAGSQHEFRAKLIETIGEEKTDSFYTAWLDSHFSRIDVDSMKSWGFNSIRVAMHYIWFTPPIEDEPVQGEITWLDEGFERIDSLLDWCGDNEMYLILDMHGAPGGQGKGSEINDYDPTLPSLWESQANQDKLVALWKKLAERYKDEPWIGGYDQINEPHWDFTNNNAQLWNLQKKITNAIREVDTNHIVVIEGNWYANNYDGLPAIWDDNLILSFHKYWSYNHENSLNWMTSLRNSRNVPLWLGESGENSNTWFTNLISLAEKNRIGWSWWPVKKPGINNPLKVTINSEYTNLIDYWRGKAANPGTDAAFNAVLQFAENHKLENCIFMKDVVDAMIRQPHSSETLPFKTYQTDEPIFGVDYNLGRNGFAYFDNDTANYHGSTNEFTNWNNGWEYRNDGVDIEKCNDTDTTNGYSVGWTGDGEWMEYTVTVDSTASYTLDIRSASGASGSKVHLEADGKIITPAISLPGTSGWQTWKTTTTTGVNLAKGTLKIRFVCDKGGSNLNYFSLSNPIAIDSIPFQYIFAETSNDGKYILLTLNKPVTSDVNDIEISDFTVTINNETVALSDFSMANNIGTKISLEVEEELYYGGTIKLSYTGNSILNMQQALETFENKIVENKLPKRFSILSRIQSEDFFFNKGMTAESCTDSGGGYDMGYANPGDYLDYNIYVPETRYYKINLRIATIRSNSQLVIQTVKENTVASIDTVLIPATGGWQSWKTISTNVLLEEGRYTLRMYVRSGEFNTNWFQGVKGPLVSSRTLPLNQVKIYPNPANDFVYIDLSNSGLEAKEIVIHNALGQTIKKVKTKQQIIYKMDVSEFKSGLYFIAVRGENRLLHSSKFLIDRKK